MTVMPTSGEVADKAVSTEDASSNVEVARLEAVLATLVETKVESMKASASTATRRVGSAPASPRRPRLTSSSTVSSSQNHYHHHHHHHHHHHNGQQNDNHHHHHHHDHKHDKKKQEDRKHRRHDSAPCGEFIGVAGGLTNQTDRQRTKYGKGHPRDTEQPKSPRKRRRHSRSPQGPPGLRNVLEDPGPESGLALLGIDRDQQLDLLNFERAREAFGDTRELPRLQQSSCCFSQSATQLKIHYDVDDYVALNLEDELEDEEDSHNDQKKRRGPCDKYHRPKRKRKRRRRRIGPGETSEELADPEELPPRARWTIVATACLLLAMSLLLVGVTLRMAPIIDDMVRRENEELLSSLSQDSFVPENSTAQQ
ncbi:uncharacterized protein LOC124413031 [Diprion similis]|uniref:uncharacterized protein LOC124413031 n=1 Tax=Diprion similis TaxID=362088 RepID=UPI001EF86D4D|nr:uncharacterized protein LOC124413031 [Diprion similis]